MAVVLRQSWGRFNEAVRFGRTEKLAAIALAVATVAALAWANSPWAETYYAFWHTPLSLQLADWELTLDLKHWVNDGLMALFFFVVGLEVKRELAIGELTDRSRAVIPVVAALAGLAVPAAIFLFFNPDGPATRAWAVVISTDTAFLLGALAIFGPKRSARLRAFLLTLAVADDIGALAVIAVFYTEELRLIPLLISITSLLVIFQLSRLRVWRGPVYLTVAVVTWLAMYTSGVHPTLAGVAIAMLLPVYPPRRSEVERAADLTRAFRQSPNPVYARRARLGLERAVSVNERLMRLFQPYTGLVIVPIFALANAGVSLSGATLRNAFVSPLTWGVITGLVLGKLIGITGATALVAKLRPGSLAPGLSFWQIAGGAALSGIGFTISLFIVDLALPDPVLADEARVGVLTASLIATALGGLIFAVQRRLGTDDGLRSERLLRPVDPRRDHVRGPADAPLTLIEYGDFECPFCSRATGSIFEVREHFGDGLRYVFRHLPLTSIHPRACDAARASEAAGAQGKFWEMHDLLFKHSDALNADNIVEYANQLGLDRDRFDEDLRRGDYLTRVQDDAFDAEVSEVDATPTFYIGDRRHHGPYDAATLIAELSRSLSRGAG